MEQPDPKPPLILLPATKAQRMNRIKDAWEKIGQAEAASAVDVDVKRATLLAEELAEEAREGPLTEKDIAEATGLTSQRIGQLLRYQRFLVFCRANETRVSLAVHEKLFRQYWQQMSDPAETRGKRDPEKKHAYERRVFLGIIEWLEAGKEPLKWPKPRDKPTVEQLFTKKKPVTALRKEVERRYKEELEPLVIKAKGYFGRDRATYAPDFMAQAMVDIEKWHKNLLALLADFDNYVKK